MKTLKFLLFALILIIPSSAFASVTLPWSTTFDCAEDWTSYSQDLSCDGISKGLNQSPGGNYEQIIDGANNPDGGGGKGQRHWIGDGTNSNSGGTRAYINNITSKIWVRWYIRWQSGFDEFGQYKDLYMWTQSLQNGPVINNFYPGGGMSFEYLTSGNVTCNSCGWGTDFYTGGVSDGTWVYHEVMIDVAGGNARMWVGAAGETPRLVIDASGLTWKGSVYRIDFGSNQKNVANGQIMYVDYDDISIQTNPTGQDASGNQFIGPLGTTPTPDTTDPTVSITSPLDSSTVSGTINATASATDNVGVVGVQFKIDGSNYGSEDTTYPYSISVDTTGLTNDSHTISAVARDAAGNTATSATVSVTVNNSTPSYGDLLFYEPCEDTSFAARGWYDNAAEQVVSATEYQTAEGSSTGSCEFYYETGGTTPYAGTPMRRLFTPSDELYISYYVKYSSNWVGSQHAYHPHEFFLMSVADGDWGSPNYTFLQAKIEQNALKPRVIFRDDKRINESSGIPFDLVSTTEDRAVNGCNGLQGGGVISDCYQANSKWYNGKDFLHTTPVLTAGSWHKVEVHLKMNTTGATTTNADGVVEYWVDGAKILDYSNAVFVTSDYDGNLFNQFGIAPYIGDGSPIDQTFWVDDLRVYSGSVAAVYNNTKITTGTTSITTGTTPIITQ